MKEKCCGCRKDCCGCEKHCCNCEKQCCSCKKESCKYEKKYCDCYCCDEYIELVNEAICISTKARVAILAIFEYKDPCENKDVLEYFYCKAKEALKCLCKVLSKLSYYFNMECFECPYEASYIIQRAIRNTELAIYQWDGLGMLKNPCCNECEYCEAVNFVRIALERIEDVVREVETLSKLLKSDECRGCY